MLEITTSNEEYYNPAGAYLATLGTDKSRRSAIWGLRIAARVLTESEDYLQVPWCAIGAPEAAYLRTEVMKQYKYSSANLVLATVRGVLGQCFELEQIDANQHGKALRALKNVKGKSNGIGRLVTPEEVAALLNACDDTPKGIRDKAMIYTAYSCGLRRSEVGKVTIDDLNLDSGTLTVAGAKGNKTQEQYLSAHAVEYLQEWLNIRGMLPGALFVNIYKAGRLGMGITPRGYAEVLKGVQEKAGIPKFTSHDLRRSAITKVALEKDIYTAQNFARHEDIQTTLNYIRAANLRADLRQASELF